MNKYHQIQHVLCTVYIYLSPNLDISLATFAYIALLLLSHVLGQTARDRTTAHKMADPLKNC